MAGDKILGYGELRERVREARQQLRRAGVSEGDNVAIACGNTVAFVVCYLAVLGVGGVAVPVNPAAPQRELAREVSVVRAQLLLVPAGEVSSLVEEGGGGAQVVEVSEEGPPRGARGGEEPGLVDRRDDDLAALMFTAGTAGAPKAARLTHGNMLSNLEQIQRHPALRVDADDVVLGALPLFHIFGLGVVLGSALNAGASLVLMERYSPAEAIDLIEANGVTVLPGVPPMFDSLRREASSRPDSLSSVRRAVCGAAPLLPEAQAEFSERFGIPLWQGYGLTEASPLVTSSLVGGKPKPGSIGKPVEGVEVRLVDTDGRDSLVGDPGEIWVRGPNVFDGYWEDDTATKEVLTADGWLRTGDVAVADEEGDLWLVDRRKDLVIVSGFNVFPAEVEDVLLTHPDITDAAVVGVPDESTGEAVKAFVVSRQDPSRPPLREADVIHYCAGHLARYKCPRQVAFVDALARGATGKLLRQQLR